MSDRYDVAVVGTGPGGYVAAIRCAQLGLTVAAIEDDRPGGVCLNWGCIPTKALLRNAEVVGLVSRAEEFGITVGEWRADYAHAVQRSRRVADRMAKGVEFLFRKNKITLYRGAGSLTGRNAVEIAGESGKQTHRGQVPSSSPPAPSRSRSRASRWTRSASSRPTGPSAARSGPDRSSSSARAPWAWSSPTCSPRTAPR